MASWRFFFRWHGILLVSNSEGDGKHTGKYGSRSPGVFFHPKLKKIRVNQALSGKKIKNWDVASKDIMAVDKDISFLISQEMEDGKLMFKVNYEIKAFVPSHCDEWYKGMGGVGDSPRERVL